MWLFTIAGAVTAALMLNIKIICLIRHLKSDTDPGWKSCLYSKYGIAAALMYLAAILLIIYAADMPAAYIQMVDLSLSLAIIAVVDIKKHIIPNIMLIAMIISQMACEYCMINNGIDGINLITAAVMTLVLLLVSVLSKQQIGMGDIKLLIAVDLIYGLPFMLYSLIFALIAMLFFAVPLIIAKKLSFKSRLPFAPFYLIGVLAYIIITV